jgi:signal transduction histidine kinase
LVETMATPALLHALLVEVERMAAMLDTAGAATRELRSAIATRIDLDLGDCHVLLAEVTARRGIDLVWEIDTMPPLPFDTQVLRSLLCNLVTNAIDACTDSDCIEVCAMLEDGAFVLQVLDTGAGMSPDTLAHCTEAFFSTKPGGFGIGLALCRELVEAAGGSFEIVSRPGSGTRVAVWLPLDPGLAPRLANHLD